MCKHITYTRSHRQEQILLHTIKHAQRRRDSNHPNQTRESESRQVGVGKVPTIPHTHTQTKVTRSQMRCLLGCVPQFHIRIRSLQPYNSQVIRSGNNIIRAHIHTHTRCA